MSATYQVRPEVAGGLGDQTDLDSSVHPPRVKRLHYVFSGWSGSDIVESFPSHIVTKRLADAIASAGLTGVELADVYVTKDPQFDNFFPDAAADLPEWRWLRVVGKVHDDFWLDDQAVLHVSQRAYDLLSTFNLSEAEIREV